MDDTPAGTVSAIYLAAVAETPMRAVAEAEAVAGAGLRGDRNFDAGGLPAAAQLTLIASEAIEAANREHGLALDPADTRRQVVTTGIDVNALVGREFTVGEVRAGGVELCEPCAHLQRLTGQPVVKALVHRGGLRAEVLEGGTIREGDTVAPA